MDEDDFRAEVARIMADGRSWAAGGDPPSALGGSVPGSTVA